MQSRLYDVIENILIATNGELVDCILDYIDIEHTGNRFDDLVDIVQLCDTKGHGKLSNLGFFKKKLVNKIYKERGQDGNGLIQKIMKYS